MGSPDALPEQLPAARPGGHPQPRRPAANPLHVHDSHVQSAPTPSSPPTTPPPHTTQASTRTPEGTIGTIPTSGARGNANPWTRCSPSAAAARPLVGRCIASPSGPTGPGGSPRTGGCGWSRCAPAEGSPPKPQGTHPPTPHHPTALPKHGGSPPHGAAVAGPRHPHPKLPPPHRGGHARHPAMLLRTPNYLQQTHPHVPEQIWPPPG